MASTQYLLQAPRRADPAVLWPERLSRWARTSAFLVQHLLPLGLLWTGVSGSVVALIVGLYAVRMFGVTAGYHRYFSHRTFKTSRPMQLLLALLAQSSAQKGVLWWASHHRNHHKYSDTPKDVHSPVQRGFWYSHIGWILDPQTEATDLERVRDLAKYPELLFLNRYHVLPAVALAAACTLWLGWAGLFAFFASNVLLYHGTFFINSLAHVWGSRRFDTSDDSRNNFWLALVTLGEGWHNNHHHYMSSARQGFRPWEVDITYYVLAAMQKLRLIRDLRQPPAELRRG